MSDAGQFPETAQVTCPDCEGEFRVRDMPDVQALTDAARAEALDVAALLLERVVDYWDGRPLRLHGEHIYADLTDVLTGIRGDAKHNRDLASRPGDPS